VISPAQVRFFVKFCERFFTTFGDGWRYWRWHPYLVRGDRSSSSQRRLINFYFGIADFEILLAR
ncbi:MAG: hypothetical protein ACK47D_11200, partial [Pseudanabaena sp.]